MIIVKGFLLFALCLQTVKLQKPSQSDNNPSFYNIGGVLSNNDSSVYFTDTIAVMLMRLAFFNKFYKQKIFVFFPLAFKL